MKSEIQKSFFSFTTFSKSLFSETLAYTALHELFLNKAKKSFESFSIQLNRILFFFE